MSGDEPILNLQSKFDRASTSDDGVVFNRITFRVIATDRKEVFGTVLAFPSAFQLCLDVVVTLVVDAER